MSFKPGDLVRKVAGVKRYYRGNVIIPGTLFLVVDTRREGEALTVYGCKPVHKMGEKAVTYFTAASLALAGHNEGTEKQ